MPIQLNDIQKHYGKHAALLGLSLEVSDGELFGVIGPDGAGKSTMFRILASLLLPDRGTCRVNGLDVVRDYREIRRIIGYMPGRFSLYLDLSVEENLSFYAGVFGTRVTEHYDLIREVYSQIEPFRKRLAGRLSGGMKQKLALSCALIHRPKILILDEPTTGVDAVSRVEFWEMLKKIRAEGITILVSTPYMDEAALCDRVLLLQKGKMLDTIDPSKRVRKGGHLYALRDRSGVYRYLRPVRELPECIHAWLFGNELHVTLSEKMTRQQLTAGLKTGTVEDLEWEALEPSIEDRFMELIQKREDEQP